MYEMRYLKLFCGCNDIIINIKDLIIQVYKVASIKAVICTNFVVIVYYAFYKDIHLQCCQLHGHLHFYTTSECLFRAINDSRV